MEGTEEKVDYIALFEAENSLTFIEKCAEVLGWVGLGWFVFKSSLEDAALKTTVFFSVPYYVLPHVKGNIHIYKKKCTDNVLPMKIPPLFCAVILPSNILCQSITYKM